MRPRTQAAPMLLASWKVRDDLHYPALMQQMPANVFVYDRPAYGFLPKKQQPQVCRERWWRFTGRGCRWVEHMAEARPCISHYRPPAEQQCSACLMIPITVLALLQGSKTAIAPNLLHELEALWRRSWRIQRPERKKGFLGSR